MASTIETGDRAPDFTLPDERGIDVHLYDALDDGPVMLVFYPADFSPVCTRQMCNYRDRYDDFQQLGIGILAISDDPVDSHLEFRQDKDLPFPLLSDPEHEVIDVYTGSGLLSGGGAYRANFIIDTDGVVHYAHVETISLFRRNADELLEAAREVAANR